MQGKVSPDPNATRVYVGIDVCKERLDVYLHPLGQKLAANNDANGIRRLKRLLKGHDVALVVMEATGKLHRLAHRSFSADGFRVAIVNPLRSRLFAEAIGTLAKTDAVDARILAIFGETIRPAATEPPSELLESLQELVRGRQAARDERTALLNRIGASKTKCLLRELNRQLRTLDASIANLDVEIKRLIKGDPCLARRFEILGSIPSIGETTAAVIIVELQEIGTLSAKETAMLAGLAPVACDSGETSGARHIRGGRWHLRNALYMPAQTAIQHNPDLKPFYDRLIAKGKEAMVALTAVMRKLLILANTLVREDRLWQPNHA
jgi:transposase